LGLQVASAWAQVAQQTCNANIPLTQPDSRYEAVIGATPAGSEVRDKVTGLIWQRCVVGMVWGGSTCTGTASSLTWPNALDAARTATASTVPAATAWRVPNHAELYSLAERACYNPAINTTWFAATPASPTWSSSPKSDYTDRAWFVHFYDGNVSYSGKGNVYFEFNADRLRVRLVRSGQ
jgi:hypothetical protein